MNYVHAITLCYVYVFIYVLLYLLILIFVSISLYNQILYIYMYYQKATLIYCYKIMHLYNLEITFTEIFTYFRLFILSYHVVYIVNSLDSGRWSALISNKG